jgi:hypothetical protein
MKAVEIKLYIVLYLLVENVYYYSRFWLTTDLQLYDGHNTIDRVQKIICLYSLTDVKTPQNLVKGTRYSQKHAHFVYW